MNSANPIATALSANGAKPDLLKAAAGLSTGELSKWLLVIDESAYTVEEWAESLISFDEWTEREGRTLDILHKLEYLSCCAESAKSSVKLPLEFLLQEFLKSNGVE